VTAAILVSGFSYKQLYASPERVALLGPIAIRVLDSISGLNTLEGVLLLVLVLHLATRALNLKRRFAEKTITRPSDRDV
jgi:hypothetical protein